MIKGFLTKGIIAVVPELLKDRRGKWSSKRTISGVLAVACAINIDQYGITTNALILAAISVIPLCFSVFEKTKN